MEIVLPTWLGSYYGSDLTFEEYEVRTVNYFGHISNTTALAMENRWFDYERLHPLQATYYFVECYRRISKSLSKRYFGVESAGCRYEDFLKSQEKTSFWAARGFCDIYGIEYPWFIYTMTEYLLESGKFKNRLPRPQHLVNLDEESAAMLRLWEMKCDGEVLKFASDPYYKVANWEGHEKQIAHEQFLIRQVKQKRVKHFALASLIYKDQILRFETAAKEFPDDIEEAISVSYSLNSP